MFSPAAAKEMIQKPHDDSPGASSVGGPLLWSARLLGPAELSADDAMDEMRSDEKMNRSRGRISSVGLQPQHSPTSIALANSQLRRGRNAKSRTAAINVA